MSTEVRDKSVKENAWKVCKDFLTGPWQTVTLEELKLFEMRGGFSNPMYRCVLPSTISTDPGVPKEVLLRIYGPIKDDPNVVTSEAVTFMLLSERNLGPKLYGIFPKGRLEEYIPSRCISSDELRLYSPLIAREIAKIHALDVPVKKVPELFTMYSKKWLDEVQEILLNDKEKWFMSSDEFKKEIEWMNKEMESMKSPILYCHNDLQPGNVLLREDSTQSGKPNLILIDFEFGAYNYRSFDFANHFNEWCFDYGTEEYPHFRYDVNRFPTKEEQREFFKVYLDQLKKEGVRPKMSMEEEINKMLSEIPLFICACHLLGSIWCIRMLLTSGVGIAFKEHANLRIKLYQKFKEQYLESTSNGTKDS